MLDKGIMVLQICTDFLKVEPGSISDTCPAFSHGGDLTIDIYVEEDPMPIHLTGIMAEHEVNFMSVCPWLGTLHRYLEVCIVFLISICPHESYSLY
jgi:hypothetical protein